MNIQLLNTSDNIVIVNTYLSEPVAIKPNELVCIAIPDI